MTLPEVHCSTTAPLPRVTFATNHQRAFSILGNKNSRRVMWLWGTWYQLFATNSILSLKMNPRYLRSWEYPWILGGFPWQTRSLRIRFVSLMGLTTSSAMAIPPQICKDKREPDESKQSETPQKVRQPQPPLHTTCNFAPQEKWTMTLLWKSWAVSAAFLFGSMAFRAVFIPCA